MIKNIILDVGKVLVEWDPMSVFRKLGFEEALIGPIADATINSPEWDEFDRSARPDEEILESLIENAPEYEKEIRIFWEHVGEAIWTYPYAVDWINDFKKNGYRVYILSNYSSYTYEKTREALKCTELADGRIFSYEVKQVKPEPEIYQTLLTRYQLIPEESVFIDDKMNNVIGAIGQGIHGIQFQTLEQVKEQLRELGVKQ